MWTNYVQKGACIPLLSQFLIAEYFHSVFVDVCSLCNTITMPLDHTGWITVSCVTIMFQRVTQTRFSMMYCSLILTSWADHTNISQLAFSKRIIFDSFQRWDGARNRGQLTNMHTMWKEVTEERQRERETSQHNSLHVLSIMHDDCNIFVYYLLFFILCFNSTHYFFFHIGYIDQWHSAVLLQLLVKNSDWI